MCTVYWFLKISQNFDWTTNGPSRDSSAAVDTLFSLQAIQKLEFLQYTFRFSLNRITLCDPILLLCIARKTGFAQSFFTIQLFEKNRVADIVINRFWREHVILV